MTAPILVPLDGSVLAETALQYAVDEAKHRNAPLVLLRVISSVPVLYQTEPGFVWTQQYQDIIDAERTQAHSYMDEKATELRKAGLDVTVKWEMGDPADCILKVAETVKPALLVLATHGRTGVGRWFFGSVAEGVLRHATVPLLLIRAGVHATIPAEVATATR